MAAVFSCDYKSVNNAGIFSEKIILLLAISLPWISNVD